MTDITVRPTGPEEWRLYRSVRLAALADAPYAFCSTWSGENAFPEERWRERLTRRNTFLAEDAEDGGRPCGLVSVLPEEPRRAELVSMWVAPGARGRGAADLLVEAALAWADGHGRPEVRLWVTEGNEPAERLYARHGFRRTGEWQSVREGEDTREFAMVRPEPPAPGDRDDGVSR
ncbi:GNAT family N-acetyltransferase [Streptomyces sp. AV19]|uniref:GNAT family N-acetyltransferase n=1 Tax=Streptomyces sp. AV19 TaxID=2793068 RepID=UPI0018FE8ADF|nr:GNAT family N-acetyltransferase [Streptomyces sp. AV19]MBH1936584.1 GNAT family N-acetyltransferase [Streptomyces sp. AV19]MDG4532644.1 GNAT family N-acetyltransferase [Streptomyces sp. AV19]